MLSLIITLFVALSPKCYSYEWQLPAEFNRVQKERGYGEFIDLDPEAFSKYYKNQAEYDDIHNKTTNKKVLKGISKSVVKNQIKTADYVHTQKTCETLNRTNISIRSFNHEIYTYKQEKKAFTAYYDKMVMLNETDCVPFGHDPL